MLFSDFIALIYPQLCCGCGSPLPTGVAEICTRCRHNLPLTGYHLQPHNPLNLLFAGRTYSLDRATAAMRYTRGGKVQRMVHALKYRNHRETGRILGRMYGDVLLQTPYWSAMECIVPVPLHPEKLKRRGYNQSAVFADGLSETMSIPVVESALIRAVFNPTQTRKSRMSRWDNVAGIFQLADAEPIQGKHLLLVDDVISTGSTIEACVHALEKIPDVRICVAAIAFAEHL